MKIPVMKAIRLCDLELVTDFISTHDLRLVLWPRLTQDRLLTAFDGPARLPRSKLDRPTWYVGPGTLQNGPDETVRWTMSWNQIRILLLIRDPRGILNSRKPLMTQLDHDGLVKNVMWTCKHNLKNLNDLRKNDLVSFLDTSRGRNKIFSNYYVTLLRNKLT